MSSQALKAAATAAQVEQQDPAAVLFKTLDSKKEEIKKLLPREINIDQFIGVCKTAVLQNPDIAQADRRTFFTSCMNAANDGLFPDGKEAVLNVYNTKIKIDGRDTWIKKVQYLPMAGGMIKKLYATGLVTFVDACAVYEADQFDYERGDNPRLSHRPTMDDNPGEIICAYAVIKLRNGEIKREVMPRRDIEKVRASSKAPDGPGWKTWYDQFAIKSVIKRSYKQLPKMKEVESVFDHDDEAMGFESRANNTLDNLGIETKAQSSAPALEHQPAYQMHSVDAATGEVYRETAFGLRDAFAAVKSGDIDLARDIARSLSEADQKDIEAAIRKATAE